MSAVAIEGVTHRYGERTALDGVSFEIGDGEIFGLLGPNGGGKTTLFRIASTLMAPTAGTVRVRGHDVVREAAAVRRSIGVVFQAPSLDKKLTAWENLRHHGHLYGLAGADLRRRAEAMLDRVGLADRAHERVEDFSGGLRRRVELAKGLLHEPSVLLLDEAATGLDPGGRRDLWTYLRGLEGVTCFLTTHLMEEAERCDRLAILDRGRVVAQGAPDELRARIGGDVVTLASGDAGALAAVVTRTLDVDAAVVDGRVRFEHADAAAVLPRLLAEAGALVTEVRFGRPTLEDVFVHETGHRFWSDGG